MGRQGSDMFEYFKILILQGLVAARKHSDKIITLVDVMRAGNTKESIITIGTWYKALWSPNLIQNHNKKVFHESFEIHLFLGNVPPLQCITELPDDSNSQKKTNIIFSGQNLIKMYNCTRKWWNTIISPYLSNISTQELISHT